MGNLPPDDNEFPLALEAAPDNMNGWIEEDEEEEDEKEDLELKEEEEEELEIDDEMDDPKVIHPYEIDEGELPPPPAESYISSDTEPEVEAEVEDETEAATVGTITRAPYYVHLFSSNSYVGSGSSRQVIAPSLMRKDVDTLHRKSVSTLEYQVRGLMLEDREEKERLKKKLKIPPSVDEERPIKANGDVTTLNDAQPSEPRGSARDS
nr:hypothetical protein [Tanacetum cinerariifolium]